MKQFIPLAFQVSSTVAPSLAATVATELFLRPKRHPYTKREEDLLQQAQVETLQSGRKAYFWGQGPLVVFVHGWESRGSAFYKWIPLFVECGYQVMAWDGPAHGNSPGTKTHAPDFARALAQDLIELSKPLHGIVGHSLGGVVVGILNKYIVLPEKVVIISAPAFVSSVIDRYHDQIHLSKRARKIFTQKISRETGLTAMEASLAVNDISKKSDTLLIHDLRDREVPFSDFEILKTTWTQARFIATEGLGHRRILRDESVGHQILDFFKAS